jgi:uncharacterized protein (DUF4213/DUF364 family)
MNTAVNDTLFELFHKFPYREDLVKQFAVGQKYVGIMLTNGSIGVSATLMHGMNTSPEKILENPDFTKYEHRIVANAWINANQNYSECINGKADIFEAIDFASYKSLVMVGYFGSLVQKFVDKGLKITIFDLNEQEVPVEPIENQKEAISNSDGVILTSTTLANGTFQRIMGFTTSKSKVFMLGPSTPLTADVMDMHSEVCGLFGARFKPHDDEVLSRIAEGGGTRTFLSRMEKVYLLRG